jgi:CRISPR-associated protein Cas2
MAGPGRALLVYQHPGEQRLPFEVHDHAWEPVNFDGTTLIRRPTQGIFRNPAIPQGWSKASRRRKFGRRTPATSTAGIAPNQSEQKTAT